MIETLYASKQPASLIAMATQLPESAVKEYIDNELTKTELTKADEDKIQQMFMGKSLGAAEISTLTGFDQGLVEKHIYTMTHPNT